MALWLGAIVLSLVRWTSLTLGSQGRLLFAAIVPIAVFLVLGLRAWFLPRGRDIASLGWVGALLVLAIVTPWRWIAPSYARPAAVERLPDEAVPLDIPFGESITLRGVRFPQELARPGEPFPVDLYWETSRALAKEDEVMIWLRMIQESAPPDDPARGVVGLEDSYSGAGALPVSLWPVEQLLAGREYIHVGPDTPAPIIARLDVSLYEAASGQGLAHPGEDLPTVGRVKIVPGRWPRPKNKQPIASLGPGISLGAVDVRDRASPGERLPVTLTWIVEERPRQDYTVFLHLRDDRGRVWGYGDGAPRGGNYPTWWWAADEVIVDKHLVIVDPDTPAGRYALVTGLYGADGRVPAYGQEGARHLDDAVFLRTVEVE
jgi:hypothetical protein